MATSNKGNKGNKAPEAAVSTSVATVGGQTYRKKAVTMPFMLVNDGATVVVKVDGPMHKLTEQHARGRKNEDGKTMDEPMTVCLVTALADVPGKKPIKSGRQYHLICNKVIQSNLDEHYPDQSYVGKVFEITNNGKAEGKRHKDFEISELLPEAA